MKEGSVMKNIFRFLPILFVLLSLLLAVPAAAETAEDKTMYASMKAEIQTLSRTVEELQLAIDDLEAQNRDMTIRMETLIALIGQNGNIPEKTDISLSSSGTGSKIFRYLPLFFLLPALGIAVVILLRRRPLRSSVAPRRKDIPRTGNDIEIFTAAPFGGTIPETSEISRFPQEKNISRIDFEAYTEEDSVEKIPEEKKPPAAPQPKRSCPPAAPSAVPASDLFVQAAAGTDVMQQLKPFSLQYYSPTRSSLKEIQGKKAIQENTDLFRSYRLSEEKEAAKQKTAYFVLVNNMYLYPNLPENFQRIQNFWHTFNNIQPHLIFQFKDISNQSIHCHAAYQMQLVKIVPATVKSDPNNNLLSVVRPGELIFR